MKRPQRVQLNRALSKLGLGSRTQAMNWIRHAQVKVNGRLVLDPLHWVALPQDRIEVIAPDLPAPLAQTEMIYLLFYKPRGVVTTRSDERGRKTVYDLLPAPWNQYWLFPVGRLDKDSEGLLVFTNDGVLADRLTDPENHIPKTYRVRVNPLPTEPDLDRLRGGLSLANQTLRPARITAEPSSRWLVVELQEGKNRQIRRMFAAIGSKVERLVRIGIGGLTASELKSGEVQVLDTDGLRLLQRQD